MDWWIGLVIVFIGFYYTQNLLFALSFLALRLGFNSIFFLGRQQRVEIALGEGTRGKERASKK